MKHRARQFELTLPGESFALVGEVSTAVEPCRHLTGYWINRDWGNFRCYSCQCQFHIGDDLPADHPTAGIEVWEADQESLL